MDVTYHLRVILDLFYWDSKCMFLYVITGVVFKIADIYVVTVYFTKFNFFSKKSLLDACCVKAELQRVGYHKITKP